MEKNIESISDRLPNINLNLQTHINPWDVTRVPPTQKKIKYLIDNSLISFLSMLNIPMIF